MPDVQARLESSHWTNRTEVLNRLFRPVPDSPRRNYEPRYNLPISDYGYVIDAVIEGFVERPDVVTWRKMEAAIPIWLHVIKTYQLNATTARIARLTETTNDSLQGFSLVMLSELGAREHDHAIAALLQAKNEQLRRPARDLLVKFESKEVVPTLITELESEHEIARFYAIEALGKIPHPSAVPGLVRSLGDTNEDNRVWALRALRAIFQSEKSETNIIPHARTVFRDSQGERAKCEALALMVHNGALDSIQPVMTRLTGTNELARSMMDDALREVSPQIMVPAYISALQSNAIYAGDAVKSDHVRTYLIGQLGRMKSRESIPLLLKLSSKEHGYLRHWAIRALGAIGSTEAVPTLIDLLKEQRDAERGNIHDETIVALFQLKDPRALQPLKEYLSTPGLDLGSLAFGFNGGVFPEFNRDICVRQVEFVNRGTPTEMVTKLIAEMGIKIHISTPQVVQKAPILPSTEMRAGHPIESSIIHVTTRLSEAYNCRFTYVIGDGEVFIVNNESLPKTFITIFENMTKAK